jgi:hypothetical protein
MNQETYSRVERTVEVDPISSGVVTIRKLNSAHLSDHNRTLINQALNCGTGGVLR